jgi:hypothetical protein
MTDTHNTIERPAIVEDKHLEYLDALRESGETNMWGSPAYVERAFGVNKSDSRVIVKYWMDTFGQRHPD